MITLDILHPPCFFLWRCFLKNNINHPLFLWRRRRRRKKSTCEWLPLGSLGTEKLYFKKKKISADKKKSNLATKTQYFCWTQWVVSESKARFSPNTNPPTCTHTHTHIKSARIHMRSETETCTHQSTGPVHWGGLCFLSVGGRDEVMINMGDVWKCKSVLQHK